MNSGRRGGTTSAYVVPSQARSRQRCACYRLEHNGHKIETSISKPGYLHSSVSSSFLSFSAYPPLSSFLHYLFPSFPLLLGAVSLVSTCNACPGVEEVKLDYGAFFRKNLELGPSIVFKLNFPEQVSVLLLLKMSKLHVKKPQTWLSCQPCVCAHPAAGAAQSAAGSQGD